MVKTLVLGAGGMGKAFGGLQLDDYECDVREIQKVIQAVGLAKPKVVIMTAGVSHPGRIGDVSHLEELEVNLIGAFNVATACVLHNVKTMIFIASVAGLYGKPNHASYSASKAGVISLVQSLAMEGYNAYAISPGRVDTPMREKDYPNDTKGSRLKPEQIANIVNKIIAGDYQAGDNIIIRKVGLVETITKVAPTPWREELNVGKPVTI